MDPRRRQLLLSVAALPATASLFAAPMRHAAAATSNATPEPILLRAAPVDAGLGPSLRYGVGPTVLRVKRGAAIRIMLENGLASPTSLDLHGVRVSPPLGGRGPVGGAVMPGTRREIVVTPPDSGTFWFHPWRTDPLAGATAAGLAGAFIVEEDAPPEVDREIVLLLTDLQHPDPLATGPATPLQADGGSLPQREALRPASRVRLRLINGSLRQAVAFACAGAPPSVVAIDGQPCGPFRPRRDSLPAGPGARLDVIFDMPETEGTEVAVSLVADGTAAPALVLRATGEPRRAPGPLPALPPNPLLPQEIALERATRATLLAASRPGDLAGGGSEVWSVNGVPGVLLPDTPLFSTKRGSPVVLAFRNAGVQLVGFRIHGFALRLLHERDDGWEPYWRDTVLVPPGATHHVAFVADLAGRWLVESPFVDQARAGLRCWFEVR